jgi:outer membrane protein
MRSTSTFIAAAAAALAACCGSALAQQHTFYVGGVYAQINSKAPPLEGGPATPAPGAQIDVGDAKTLGFGYVYRFSQPWAFEAALGIPPKHKGFGKGFIEPFGQISSVKQVSPTAFANYHFGTFAQGTIEPFVGAGINYTHFIERRSTPSGDAASGGPTKLKMTDSWGPAAHAGATFTIDKSWSIVGAIAYAQVKSKLTATTQTYEGEIVRTTTINFRPVVYTLAAGYRF